VCLSGGGATARETAETRDKNHDGKPDYWRYKNDRGVIYKKEWDRNFDGKPDLRILLDGDRMLEKQADDNFDGKFERLEKTPKKGQRLKVKTTAQQ